MSFTTTLVISGSTVTRPTARIILNRWTFSLDRPDELEFTELGVNLPGSFAPEATVQLIQNSVTVFSGWIFSRHPSNAGSGEITIGYRAIGLKYGVYYTAVTAVDGTGTMRFNLLTSDPLYSSTEAGLSVGTIISQVFSQNASALSALGITTDSTTASQLAALTAVPPDPVYISGYIGSQIDQILQQWYGSRYAWYVTGAGLVRVVDTTTLTANTLTLGTDPIKLDSISEDTSECYTSVILRGRDLVEAAFLDLSLGTLVDPNTSDEASWSYNDWLYPKGAFDQGTITALTSTTATVQSSDASLTWATNKWSGISGQISLINPAATGLTGFEYRRVISNTALVAGGTSVITFDSPIVNSGYTKYMLRGSPSGRASDYRTYTIPNTYVSQHLVPQFPYAVPFTAGSFAIETIFPMGWVTYNSGGITIQISRNFEVIPWNGSSGGYIRFYEPVVTANNSMATLIMGGSHVAQPTNVQALVPYARGTLTASYPASGYGGTAYTKFGVQRTLYRDYPNWLDPGNLSMMQTLAQNIHSTTSNVIQEGTVTYFGQYLNALPPNTPMALNLAHFSLTTGYETMAAPVRTVTLSWPQAGASIWVTQLQFSTRRQAYSGDRLYVHPNYMQGKGWIGQFNEDAMAVFKGDPLVIPDVPAYVPALPPSYQMAAPGEERAAFASIFGALPGQDVQAQQGEAQRADAAAFKQQFGFLPGQQEGVLPRFVREQRERRQFVEQFGALPRQEGEGGPP
jgi:hypothetical protein